MCRIKKAEFRRDMSPDLVISTVKGAFLGLSTPVFLECEEGNSQCLTEADNQQPDGNQLIDSAHKRKEVVYVVNCSVGRKVVTTPETSDEKLPAFDLSEKSSAK